MSTRGEVLSLYRRIFRVASHWRSSSTETSVVMEQRYIRDEARRLFKKNKMVFYIVFTELVLVDNYFSLQILNRLDNALTRVERD